MINEPAPTIRWTNAQTRAQFAAIARLRWRILINSFRRKGSAGEIVAMIVLYPLAALLALLPIVAVGGVAWLFADQQHYDRLLWCFWATFLLCQVLNIQLGQPGTTFDPTQLIRFPLRLRAYTGIRLFFGMVSPANVIGTCMSLAIAIGLTVAVPSLAPYAFLSLLVFAAANVLFTRMAFTWVDRWLSTRRAREVFTGLIFVFSLGIQYVNFTYNPAYNHNHANPNAVARLKAMNHLYQRAEPVLSLLPPELSARAITAAVHNQPLAYARLTLGCAAFAAFFLTVFALRIKTEYRGENLSDVANAVARPAKGVPAKASASASTTVAATGPAAGASSGRLLGLPPTVTTMLGKELLYIRRNTGLFYSIVAPLVFVFLFAGKLATRSSSGSWIFPAALGYALLGILPLTYNAFGLEGAGSQFYFLAPVRFRDVVLAKNLLNFALACAEVGVVFAIISYVAGVPKLETTLVSLLWAATTLLLSTTLANRRSITAPKKINPARTANKQASPLSALIGMGVLVGSAGVAAGLFLLATFLHQTWVLVPVFLVLAVAALSIYTRGLNSIDTFAMEHREGLFAELCKQS